MSSSKTAVFPATKKGAVPYSSSWGPVGERRTGWGRGRGAGVLARSRRLGGCPGCAGTGSTVLPTSHVPSGLCWAGHVADAGK